MCTRFEDFTNYELSALTCPGRFVHQPHKPVRLAHQNIHSRPVIVESQIFARNFIFQSLLLSIKAAN